MHISRGECTLIYTNHPTRVGYVTFQNVHVITCKIRSPALYRVRNFAYVVCHDFGLYMYTDLYRKGVNAVHYVYHACNVMLNT